MSNLSRLTGFGMVAACGIILVQGTACSSPSPGDIGKTDQPVDGAPGSSGSSGAASSSGVHGGPGMGSSSGTSGSTSSSSSSGSTGGLPAADLACSKMAADACGKCCDTAHAAGAQIRDDAVSRCMCGAATATTGKCQTECAASDCSDAANAPSSVTGDACDVCENKNNPDDGTGPCDAPIKTACDANADCVALTKCSDACP